MTTKRIIKNQLINIEKRNVHEQFSYLGCTVDLLIKTPSGRHEHHNSLQYIINHF